MDIEYVKQNAERTGSCGDGLTWYQVGGDLYIEGQGAVEYFEFTYNESIRNVVIAPGCTGIDSGAFEHCTLDSVILPEGLAYIGDYAFSVDSPLTLTIPDSVTQIARDAFCNVEEIIYNGPASPEPGNDNWGAVKWTCDPARRPATVAMHCHICDHLNDIPLSVSHRASFAGAEVAAYNRGVLWNNQIPVPGEELEIAVRSPFCCNVGDTFWACCGKNQYAQARLLSILEMGEQQAAVRIAVLQTATSRSFLKPVTEAEKAKLRKQRTYTYIPPAGDAPCPMVWDCEENLLHLSNTFGGGDINQDDDIYTDEDGIDHLIRRKYSDFEDAATFLGDQILGFRADSPYQWENGLLIDRKKNCLIRCRGDIREAVIPEGITMLNWGALDGCPHLERVTLPESVEYAYHAFGDNIRQIILTGNSRLPEKFLPAGAEIIRIG